MATSSQALFVDTSFYYASLDPQDPHHERARELNMLISQKRLVLISSWEVIVETVTLLRIRHNYQAAITFIRHVLPHLQIMTLDVKSRAQALVLFEKLSRDKHLSLCDVISYLLVTEHLNHIPCLAFDDDFKKLGLNVL